MIAGAILSLCLVPVVTGFFQAALNLKYSITHYQAALNVKNLIIDAEKALDNGLALQEVFGTSSFSSEYLSDNFDYSVAAYEIIENTALSFLDSAATSMELELIEAPLLGYEILKGIKQYNFNDSDGVIEYDGSFINKKGNMGHFILNKCLVGSDSADAAIVDIIFKERSNPVEIVINNIGQGYLYVNIHADQSESINILFAETDSGSIVSYYPYNQLRNYVIAAEVYDKHSKSLHRIFSLGNFVQ